MAAHCQIELFVLTSELVIHLPVKAKSSERRVKTGKEISIYNLADGVTDEQYREYVKNIKGPFLESLPSVSKFELVRIKGAVTGESPYTYVGILHVDNLDEFYQRDVPSQQFQEFLKEVMPMIKQECYHMMYGEEIY